MNAQPTTPIEIKIDGLIYLVPQLSEMTESEIESYAQNRRTINAKRYWDRVAKTTIISYDKDLLLCLYEIVFYITNGLFEDFNGVFGSVTYSVEFVSNEFVSNEPVIRINTPNSYRQISDGKDLTFTKLNINTIEGILGRKVVKELKAILPVVETTKPENEVCFEIGKSEAKKLTATQLKAYSCTKDTQMIYGNVSYPYWTYNVRNGLGCFSPVNANPVKINLDYFSGFEFFVVKGKTFDIIYEKKTGFKVIESFSECLDSELKRLSETTTEFSQIIERAKKQIPFEFDINDSIESINAKRIAQNEFYVFGAKENESVEETKIENVEVDEFEVLENTEKSFAKNYINAELKTRSIESLVNEFETELLTCKGSDKLSYKYALRLLSQINVEQNQSQTTNQPEPKPTNEPIENIKIGDIVKFTNLGDSRDVINAKVTKIDFSEQKIYFVDINYPKVGTCNFCFSSLQYWNVEISQLTNQTETMQPTVEKPSPVITKIVNYTQNRIDNWYINAKQDYGVIGSAKVEYNETTNIFEINGIENGKKTKFSLWNCDEIPRIDYVFDVWMSEFEVIEDSQPEPLTVGQVIQGENCRLVVTKVVEEKKEVIKVEAKQEIKNMTPTQRKYTEFYSGTLFTMYQNNSTKETCLVDENGNIVKNFLISNSASYRFWDKSEITLKDGQFFELSNSNPITHRKCWNQKRFVRIN